MKVFFVSLSGCMVPIVICFSVIMLKDRRLCDFFGGLRSVIFRREGGCAVFLVFSRCFCGRFCGVKIEL